MSVIAVMQRDKVLVAEISTVPDRGKLRLLQIEIAEYQAFVAE